MGIELPTGAHSEKGKKKRRETVGDETQRQRQSDGERREKEKEMILSFLATHCQQLFGKGRP